MIASLSLHIISSIY